MTSFKHALADPDYFLEITGFYWDTVIDGDIGTKVRRVSTWAQQVQKPQADLAAGVAKLVSESPPKFSSFSATKKYFFDTILSNIPKRYVYDDVFWCCFLAAVDDVGTPECSLGGPLHKMILKVHDDFDPDDVTL